MKRIVITLLLITAAFSVAACKTNPSAGTSSEAKTESEISSIVLSEGDFFTQNGTESEAELTESEVEELFKNQESRDQMDSSSKTESKDDTESTDTKSTASKETQSTASKETQSTASKETHSSSLTSDVTESKEETSKPTESSSEYDKDGDGWTDGWK